MGVLSTILAVFSLLTRLRKRLITSKTKIVKEKKFKLLSSKFKRVDIFVIFVAMSTSVTVSIFGVWFSSNTIFHWFSLRINSN